MASWMSYSEDGGLFVRHQHGVFVRRQAPYIPLQREHDCGERRVWGFIVRSQ